MENRDLKDVNHYKAECCLACGAKTNSNDDNEFYCSQCGAPVLNKCSSYNCQEILEQNAKFCKYCGSPSIFFNYGLLEDVTSLSPDNTNDLPF